MASDTTRQLRLVQLLDAIYEAGFAPARWGDALDLAMEVHGARGGRVNLTDFATGRDATLAVRGIDAEFHGRWMAERAEADLWARRGLERLMANPDRRTATGAEIVPLDELRRSPVYHEVLRPFGLEDALMTALAWSSRSLGGFALWRGPSDPLFDRHDSALHDRIGRHARRALALGDLLRRAREHGAALLERIPCAAFVCEADGRIVQRNGAGDALIRSGRGIAARGERLRATHAADQRALDRALALATRSAVGESLAGGTTLRLRHDVDRVPLVVFVDPLPPDGIAAERLAGSLSSPVALVLVSDPEARSILPEHALAEAFGLTPAESRLLAALCAGETPNDYADRKGISRETSRFHIKQLLAKTGARRQADLVRIGLESVVRLSGRTVASE